MNILFLHPNFPAQFKHVAGFAAKAGHEVKFLCQTHYGRTIKGVERITLKKSAGKDELDKQNLPVFERAQHLALQYRGAMENVKSNGWIPDIVISHSAWGCGLYAKEVFKKTKFISYSEWWFDPNSLFFHYDQKSGFGDFREVNSKSMAEKSTYVSRTRDG